ncbi:hypothetical protein [Achromobacter sp. MFA1 R4]|uniref:hypothetical protein n=1 Tax=Achromobacter sp. MFA1 R4 TaxID=1881016 RepID=UPI001560927E|nr:hypothetical protein [Achromobacter sp. MFA1 R4]
MKRRSWKDAHGVSLPMRGGHPACKKNRQANKIFPLTIALAQAFDFVDFCTNAPLQSAPAALVKRLQNAHRTLFFHNFFAFCREATCTPNLVRA